MIPSLSPRRGGPSFMLPRLAEELSRQGLEVDVATTDDDGPGRLNDSQKRPADGELVQYKYFPRTLRFYSFSRALGKWLSVRVREFDIVHVHAVFSHPSVAACFRAQQCEVPCVVRPLGVLNRWGLEHRRPWLKRISLRLIERPLLNRCAVVHCTSLAESEEVEAAGIQTRRVVIPNPVEVPEALGKYRGSWRRRLPQFADRKWLLFLSRVDPKKGLDLTLRALATMPPAERPVLLIAGDGEEAYTQELRRLQADLKLANDVVWLGFLEKSSKWSVFSDSDAFVLNSHSENFGIAVAEAMGAGLPVLVSDRVGLADQIHEHQAGIIVVPEVPQLTENISRILSPEARPFGSNGRKFVQTQLSLQSVTQRIIELYEETSTGHKAVSAA